MRRAAIALELLTKFSNLCIAGYLPSELQEFFCGGGLIPRNKKKYSGIRPNVVGEFLRGLVSKLVLKEIDRTLQALQPAQISIGGKGPAILCQIVAEPNARDEMLLKVDIHNAYNSISKGACMEGVKKYCPDMAISSTVPPATHSRPATNSPCVISLSRSVEVSQRVPK